MKRCIIYARIGGSASEVNNGLLQAQLTELRAAAKDLGLEVMAELPSSAIWHTQSGKTNKRANVPCFEARVWMAPLKDSVFVDKFIFCFYRWRSAFVGHQAVHREPEECVRYRDGIQL